MTDESPTTAESATSEEEADGNDAVGERYVETQDPPIPEVAFRVINPLIKLLLRSPLHSLVSDSLMLITFTGRKTGEEYTTPVGYWMNDGRVIVTTHSPWWRNLEGGRPVTLRLRGGHREGIATPQPDPEVVATYIQESIDRRGVDAARRLGIRIAGDRKPTLEELKSGIEGTVVIEVELADERSA